MDMCQDKRGIFKNMNYITPDRVDIHYELPLNEIIYDFFDALKSRTRGYASFDYEMKDYRKSDLVKVDVVLNGDVIDALSFIIHKDKAYQRARKIAEQLKKYIPRHLFEIPIQIAIGGKVIARETVKALRKDVLAKLYCSGGCAANAYHTTGSVNGVYEFGCELHRKRIECAIMLKVAEAEENLKVEY